MTKEKLHNKIMEIVAIDNDGREPYRQTMIDIMSLLSQYESEKQQELVKELRGMKYRWDKPIDEMPEQWFIHNETLDKAIEKVRGK